jgi:hypothetical protein
MVEGGSSTPPMLLRSILFRVYGRTLVTELANRYVDDLNPMVKGVRDGLHASIPIRSFHFPFSNTQGFLFDMESLSFARLNNPT